LKEGVRLAITGKNPATLDAARKELGSSVLVIESDASKVAAQKVVAETLRREFGGLDILFVNAGIAELKPVEQWDEAAFDRSVGINLSGGIRVNAVSPGPISTPLYSKLGLSEADVKTVAASIQGQVPAGRFGNASEIAHAVVFLASDESAFTVGSELLIDGGMIL